jgi:hypothetical protein
MHRHLFDVSAAQLMMIAVSLATLFKQGCYQLLLPKMLTVRLSLFYNYSRYDLLTGMVATGALLAVRA